ncbi:hypothetical protein JG687_00016951 [Phytophthora cactorum]|uniref:Uncharacterized protein n=1 Tax=Phytophthora cactorum TaxID=29920 RepID=A0A329SF61_9STRA|nr:hypothetical protein PC114_g20250 [Phytophthora cactorum]KAG3130941.1 hypothetical protein PI126_g20273 [Phytophthora idaei]KAG2908388.1 hypothetical protein PC117_g19966 [Phytophthora cactorum]KAG2984257.1 hypothetical protein PC120_g24275 [Phytophthora cactorum]KAG3127199.1 hypothetical protein C6341_g25066 [Phytophthora cactorum]
MHAWCMRDYKTQRLSEDSLGRDIVTFACTRSDQLSFFDPKSVSLDVLKVGSYHIVDPRYPMETFDSF